MDEQKNIAQHTSSDEINGFTICGNCGEKVIANNFCEQCGHKLQYLILCNHCGLMVRKTKFCTQCGNEITNSHSSR